MTTIKKHTENEKVKLLVILLGAVLFNMIFWEEKIAVNAAIFFTFTLIAILRFYPAAWSSSCVKWLVLSTACTLAAVIIHNSLLSKIAFSLSLIMLAAYSQYRHFSMLYAGASVIQSFLFFIPTYIMRLKAVLARKERSTGWIKRIRFIILPLVLGCVFFITYLLANKIFADFANTIGTKLGHVADIVMGWIEPQRLVFLLIGLWIFGGLLVRYVKAPMEEREERQTNNLERTRNKKRRLFPSLWMDIKKLILGKQSTGNLALKYEYKAGVLSLIVLNMLLLFVNGTDIMYLWMGFAYKPGFEWVGFVHEGAEMLVLSIVMAMLVVLFFFRGNLNFFRQNGLLKKIAFLWILQNAFLALSVCVRNYYYVTHMGLAYKRIGLFVYVLLVLAGLLFIFLKIKNRKTGYFLLRVNATIAFVVLLMASFVQWDVLIAKFNLDRKDKIPVDVAFLLTLNDHALPILEQHRDFLSQPQTSLQSRYYHDYIPSMPVNTVDYRIKEFWKNVETGTWLSWNYADEQTKTLLIKSKPLAAAK